MPTLLIQDGFRFFFYANEHEPKHVHVMKGDDFARIELVSLRVTQDFLKPKDLRNALELVRLNRLDFERRWDEYFGQR